MLGRDVQMAAAALLVRQVCRQHHHCAVLRPGAHRHPSSKLTAARLSGRRMHLC